MIAVAAFRYAFTGFFAFLIGMPVLCLSVVMTCVYLSSFLPFPPIVMGNLEQFQFQGETAFTFHGRLMVDAVLIVVLWFFMGKTLLAIFTLVLIGAVILLKEREAELFTEVFQAGSNGGGASAPVGDWSGGYQSVDT